jgi:hypothetical protein
MTIYAYDTEFLEDGRTIELISIGIVCEDGREYYAVNSDMPRDEINRNHWLMKNVMPSLPGEVRSSAVAPGARYFSLDKKSPLVKPKWVIANEVREFLLAGTDIELWADYAAYDHVALAQLWGRMINLPKGLPMYTNDLQQEQRRLGNPPVPPQFPGEMHNALADARHVMRVLVELRAVTA